MAAAEFADRADAAARVRTGAALLTMVALVAACSAPARPDARTPGRPAARGQVDVLYAGSLVRPMEDQLGPLFTRTTGYGFVGYAGGSVELANEVKGGTRRADVFVSADPGVDADLEGASNGSWVSWDARFAQASLVLAYNPRSRFAARLRTEPWYHVVTAPGFLLGRTDPALDPKGALTVQALREAAAATGDRTLLTLIRGTAGVFPEETLLGRLESGQLDGGFFYTHEARAAGLPTTGLAPVSLRTTFTVTVLAHAPHPAGALAFVRFLLGRQARQDLASSGLAPLQPPTLNGSHVPASVAAAVSGR